MAFKSVGQAKAYYGGVQIGTVVSYGFFPAFTDGIGKSMVVASVPKHIHGKAQGMYQSLAGGSILIAGTWAGLLWNTGRGNGSVPMTVAGIASALGAVILLSRRSEKRFLSES